jgi:hypothetical protein
LVYNYGDVEYSVPKTRIRAIEEEALDDSSNEQRLTNASDPVSNRTTPFSDFSDILDAIHAFDFDDFSPTNFPHVSHSLIKTKFNESIPSSTSPKSISHEKMIVNHPFFLSHSLSDANTLRSYINSSTVNLVSQSMDNFHND